MSSFDPDRLPYRLLTGGDDRAFCEKVSRALEDGYVLYGSPAIALEGGRVVCAQAVVLAGENVQPDGGIELI